MKLHWIVRALVVLTVLFVGVQVNAKRGCACMRPIPPPPAPEIQKRIFDVLAIREDVYRSLNDETRLAAYSTFWVQDQQGQLPGFAKDLHNLKVRSAKKSLARTGYKLAYYPEVVRRPDRYALTAVVEATRAEAKPVLLSFRVALQKQGEEWKVVSLRESVN
ncbi:MAG TPA: hypothetical protein VEA59_00970 [Patescibacteria group bacterium]|nr:hypothetical protein [Patescibacteria group bacterium]